MEEPAKPSLLRGLSFAFSGNLLYAACQWCTLVAIARLSGPTDVGRFSIGLAVSAPVIQFANLQLRVLQATDVKAEFSFSQYLSLRMVTTALGLTVIALIALFYFDSPATSLAILILGFAKSVESVSDIHYGLFQRLERLELVASSLAWRGVASLLFVTIIMATTSSLHLAITAQAAVWLAVLLVHDYRLARRENRQAPDTPGLFKNLASTGRAALPQAFSIGAAGALMSLYFSIPKYLVHRILGEEQLGIFSAAFHLVFGGFMIATSAGQVVMPRLATLVSTEPSEFRRLLWRSVKASACIASTGFLLAFFYGRFILVTLFGPEYAEAHRALSLIALSTLFWFPAWAMNYALNAARRFTAQPLIAALLVASLLLSTLVVIPRFGLEGAAICLVASSVLHLLSYLLLTYRFLQTLT